MYEIYSLTNTRKQFSIDPKSMPHLDGPGNFQAACFCRVLHELQCVLVKLVADAETPPPPENSDKRRGAGLAV